MWNTTMWHRMVLIRVACISMSIGIVLTFSVCLPSVYKWNHDESYAVRDTPSRCVDKIDHVYVEKFETVEEKYRSMIKRYGCKFEARR
jgi:hypothetical protein